MRDIIRQKVLETKKNLVLEEISKIFENDGFSSVKMQDIANRLNISVGALYKLFSSKDELFYEYIAYQIRLFHNMLVENCSSLSQPKLCLETYVKLKFDVFTAKRKAIEDPVIGDPLFFFKMNTQKNDPVKPIFEFLAELFERLDKIEPLKEKNYMKLAYLFNAFTMGYIEYWINYDEKLEESASVVLEEFLKGMKA
ncbi:TetR/AcrR family transcriptional regulator [Hydrogenimonas thermophila]|uniref:Transcriptional regulator, TetR family n=1 Tax=Hydrogenimonas thermophila TaxID=223786 RepID=A0A1I5N9I6_9BACT|nr:TetR/AcrR family transcriptional regulator [Hydrogenimonas thermophila]SFP18347.1 transcriptional regulator, TetR family [Hydrogenimonas thermophila]